MKPYIGITIIILILGGVFIIYSKFPEVSSSETPPANLLQASASETIPSANQTKTPDQPTNSRAATEHGFKSAEGLGQELQGILGGFNAITDELQLLEDASITPAL